MNLLRDFLFGKDRRAVFWVLLASFLLTAWKYFGSQHFYRANLVGVYFPSYDPDFRGAVYLFFSTTLIMAVIPAIISFGVFKQSPAELGLKLGDWKKGLKPAAILLPILVVLAIPSSKQPDFRAEYPFWRGAGESTLVFAKYSLSYLFFYYIPWEFFFRGVLQLGLRPFTGANIAILIQTLASTLVHIGKPTNETFGAIFGGVMWGLLAEQTGSLVYPILMHWILGTSLDAFVLFMGS